MRASLLQGLVLVPLVTTAISAQAPVITPAGDPSIDPDTIYALAVNPADHPDESTVLLLDDGVVRYESDGTGVRTYRMVAQVLKKDAVETWAEHTFTYHPERQRFQLNWIRVLDTDGHVISDEPLHRQETEVPVPEGSPVFTGRRQVRLSLAGVAPGTIVDYSYTMTTVDPVLTGDLFGSWFINPGSTIRRSRLLLDLPAALEPRIRAVDLDFEPRVERVGDRVVREWFRADIPRTEPEPFVPDSNGVTQRILYSGALDWADIGAWYAGLAADRYEVTPAVRSQLGELVADARTLTDSLRAVHRWIAQDVRYVSLSLGIGGYQPRTPADVLSTLSGDCKDKATLFIAMARELGLEAYPVLTSSGRVHPLVPSLKQFDHAIAVVDLGDGPLYVDLTASLVPFGELPGMLHGGHGLVIRDGVPAELVEFDDPPATESLLVQRVTGELDAAGAFTGRYHESGTGLLQYDLRDGFSNDFTSEQTERVAQAIASNLFNGARGDSLEAFDGRDLTARPEVSVRVRVRRATTSTPEGDHIFTLPFTTFANEDLLTYMEGVEERVMPFHVGAISSDYAIVHELALTLPEGWQATLPESAEAKSLFGTYRSSYTQEGTELRVRREYVGGRGTAPPGALGELIEWLQGIADDDVRYIVLRPAR